MGVAGRMVGACVAVALVVLAGCSGGGDEPAAAESADSALVVRLPDGIDVVGNPSAITVEDGGGVDVDLGTGVRLEAPHGALEAGDELTVASVIAVEPPSVIGEFDVGDVGPGVWVDLDSGPAEPFTVSFEVPELGDGQSFAAARIGDDGRWEVLPADGDGDQMLVTVEGFSGIFGFVIDEMVRPIGDAITRSLGGRSEPSQCDGAPGWASQTANSSGSTHSCVRTNRGDNVEIAELEIKSNRGTYQWISLPEQLSPEYVWVEGQPAAVRAAIAKQFDSGDAVLLAPGKRMTVGYRQPVEFAQLQFTSTVDNVTGVASILHHVAEIVVQDAGMLFVVGCPGMVGFDVGNFAEPVTVGGPNLPALGQCVFDLAQRLADPNKAVDTASELLGPHYNEEQLTDLSLAGYQLGKNAKIIKLGSYFFLELTYVVDTIINAMAPGQANTTTLTLEAPRPAAPPPTPVSDGSLPTGECAERGTPAIGAADKFEVLSRCFLAAWRAGDRDLAQQFADPAAIDELFEISWSPFRFVECRVDPSRPSWLGNVCEFLDDTSDDHWFGIEMYFTAYDDAAVVSDVEFNG